MALSYSDKLKDPRWQKKRLEIMERDEWRCRSCRSDSKQLQVHHIVYSRIDPWEYSNEVLQTLCCDCHEVRQSIVDSAISAIRIALRDVPTERLKHYAEKLHQEAMEGMI